ARYQSRHSPSEFAQYVHETKSPWLNAYCDVVNVVFYGYPQDWIRTLGPRIAKVHLKDFKLDRPNGRFNWVNLGEGDIDWVEVRKAFAETGYGGWMTTELSAPPGGADAAYLKDVSARVDRVLARNQPLARGAPPPRFALPPPGRRSGRPPVRRAGGGARRHHRQGRPPDRRPRGTAARAGHGPCRRRPHHGGGLRGGRPSRRARAGPRRG